MRPLVIAYVLAACGTPTPTPTLTPTPKPDKRDDAATAGAELTKREAKEIILAVNAHIIILKSQDTFAEYRDVLKTVVNHPEVTAAAPFIFVEGWGNAGAAKVPLVVKAIDTANSVQKLDRYMVRGSMRALATTATTPPIILGDRLATSLGVHMGDSVQVTLPEPAGTANTGTPRAASFLIGGILHTGFEEYDERLSFTSLAAMQQLVGRGDQVMGVEALVKDTTTSGDLAAAIEKELGGPPYHVMDWFELNRSFFGTRD